jgi:spore germination cell wall hydrolase CwlJ-like protein
LGDTSLHAAFGPAPRCLPSAALQATSETVDLTLPISELGPAIPSYDPEERDYLIRTIVFEASGEPEKGKAAVAFVILNRERRGRWGDNIEEVVTQPWQFEPWMTRRREIEKLSRDDPRYQSAATIADTVLSGQMEDPTAGATHFLNPVVVRQRRGGAMA